MDKREDHRNHRKSRTKGALRAPSRHRGVREHLEAVPFGDAFMKSLEGLTRAAAA